MLLPSCMGYDTNLWTNAGQGDEAYVLKGPLAEIEGIGGIVTAERPIIVAKRTNWGNPVNKHQGHDLFCKHLILRILDEHFLRQGRYSHPHIPIPLGSFNGGCYYVFAEGSENFPLSIATEHGQKPVRISEWNEFTGYFGRFGFNAGHDIADADNGRVGKNVILSQWDINEVYETGTLDSGWKRIDFGSRSLPFDYDKFMQAVEEKKADLTGQMQDDYGLLLLAAKYSYMPKDFTSEEFRDLEERVLQFRSEQINRITQMR